MFDLAFCEGRLDRDFQGEEAPCEFGARDNLLPDGPFDGLLIFYKRTDI
jgi:hypothetical protein